MSAEKGFQEWLTRLRQENAGSERGENLGGGSIRRSWGYNLETAPAVIIFVLASMISEFSCKVGVWLG